MNNIDRRTFFGHAAGASGLLGVFGLRAALARGHAGPLFVGCRADNMDQHHVSVFDQTGRPHFSLALPERGHAMAFRPAGPEMVVFARRPGRFAVVIDADEGVALRRIDAVPGRHFYGHGVFSADGRILFATENDYEQGRGVIGLYDAADGYRRLGDHSAHGIGPHELLLMPDGKTLAIANGGIQTHPDHGRAKLNLDTMSPALVFAEAETGQHLDQVGLHNARLSIRHLALLADGRIAVAMQYEGPKTDNVPLVAIYDGTDLIPLDAPAAIQRRMRHYGGSVAVDRAGELMAVSAPRGNLVTFWDGQAGRYLGSTDIQDGSGVAPTDQPGEFLVTSGEGPIKHCRPATNDASPITVRGLAGARWDNHLRRIPQHEEPN